MKIISLPYGKSKVRIEIPSNIHFRVLNIKHLPPAGNFKRLLSKSLDNPIKSQPFCKLFTAKDRVALIMPDKSRRGYFPPVLEVLLKRLTSYGVERKNITIIIARGIHPPHTSAELKELVGDKIYHSINIIDHDCRDRKHLTYLGKTSYGTKVELNSAITQADKIITCGVIQYHYFAGFAGGRKLIMPGIAGYETIMQNHRLVLNTEPARGKNPNATLGKLSGNPVHEDMMEAIRMLEQRKHKIFSIDLVLNHKRQVSRIFCGSIRKAHEKGCRVVHQFYSARIKQPVDCIIASTGDYPSDINFIQTHKTLEHVSKVLKEKGSIFALAECSEGIGSDYFLPWFKYRTKDELETALRKDFVVNGHTALCSLIKSQRFKIYLHSKLPADIVERIHLNPVRNIQHTLTEIFNSLPGKHNVLIIPQGFNLLPQLG